MNCFFCDVYNNKEDIAYRKNNFFIRYDKHPVSKGHLLIIPNKHYGSYFDLSKDLKEELIEIIDWCKELLDKEYNPDGYNIGFNIGEAAGQTIFHFHYHIIPRYKGDMENPKGGIRGAIPDKRIYNKNANKCEVEAGC